MKSQSSINEHKLSVAGTLITLGIIYGDIGTSPIYVLNAIVSGHIITNELVYGGLSCVFWTLIIITTFKYIYLTLNADNKERAAFKVEHKVNLMFNKIVEEMVKNGEVDELSHYPSLRQYNMPADFKFILLNSRVAIDDALTPYEQFM